VVRVVFRARLVLLRLQNSLKDNVALPRDTFHVPMAHRLAVLLSNLKSSLKITFHLQNNSATCCGTGTCCSKGSTCVKEKCVSESEPADICDDLPESTDNEDLFVAVFNYVEGISEELITSMCLGMKSRQGQLGTDVSKNANGEWEEKIHRGSGDKSRSRRQKSKCRGYCRNVLNTAGNRKTTCDEYPPASACEGGKGAFRSCITEWQNSGIQGKCLRRYTSKLNDGELLFR
jgi:hypothetical protein